jgi:hypothetical protein
MVLNFICHHHNFNNWPYTRITSSLVARMPAHHDATSREIVLQTIQIVQ